MNFISTPQALAAEIESRYGGRRADTTYLPVRPAREVAARVRARLRAEGRHR